MSKNPIQATAALKLLRPKKVIPNRMIVNRPAERYQVNPEAGIRAE